MPRTAKERVGVAATEGREPPTRRGRKTRAQLVAAAREVFEREGFQAARITQIAEEAGVATGSFYSYFTDKDTIFEAVLEDAQAQMLHPHLAEQTGDDGPAAKLAAANRSYLESYRDNARLMGVLWQVASVHEKYKQIRIQRNEAFVQRNARMIERLQADGLADPALDPVLASLSLSSMVSRVAFVTYVLGQEAPLDDLVDTLTRLWVSGLRIPADAG